MAKLRNHKQFWMRDDAEASLARWEADHGIIGVNSAGRYVWEQQEFIDRWNKGGWQNRPPYLYEPKRPATASAHVANGGRAFDTSEWRRFLATCADYGWVQVYPWDVVHFEYFPERDKHRNRPSGGSNTKPKPTPKPTPTSEEEDDMEPYYIYNRTPYDRVYMIHPITGKKRALPTAEWEAAKLAGARAYDASKTLTDQVPNV